MKDLSNLPYRPCVGVALLNRDGSIFAGERGDTPGAWQMPQGGIDTGELPEAAALRELEEETSVPPGAVTILSESEGWHRYDLPEDVARRLWRGRYRGQEQKWFLMRLETGDDVINLDVQHPEFTRWAWMSAEDLLTSIVPFKRDLYEAVLTEFGLLSSSN
ncbi:MAG: RNA pyrophosphohydrolase [Pseudomonadota bacterium]